MQNRQTGVFEELTSLTASKDALVVHADEGWYSHILEGGCDFFEKIGHAARKRGLETRLVHSDGLLSAALLDADRTHILIGPKRHRGHNIFHAHPSYIRGFWYLDPEGYFWNSSLAGKTFLPDRIDANAAHEFFTRISRHRIRQNLSQRRQNTKTFDLKPANFAFFVQDIEKYWEKVHFITTEKILKIIAQETTSLCYVKPHPLMKPAALDRLKQVCKEFDNLMVLDASIHDIIQASEVIISQNSAVGFEALMHKKPVITCARSDYQHGAQVSHSGKELRANMKSAPAHFAGFPYEKYFYWFLGLNMLEPQYEEFADRALGILFDDDGQTPGVGRN